MDPYIHNDKSDALATALQSSSSRTAFWKKVRAVYRKDNNSIPLSVGNATGQTDVANMWKCHYSGLLNSASGKSCDKIFVDNFLTRRSGFCNITNFQCTAPIILLLLLAFTFSQGWHSVSSFSTSFCLQCPSPSH